MKRNAMIKMLAAALCGSTFATAATGAESALIEVTYDGSAREAAAAATYTGTCPVHVVLAQDARQNRETIGQSGGGPLLTGEMSRWVTDGLVNLKVFGFAVDEVPANGSPQDGLVVRATLTRAYTWQVGLKIFSMVALKVQFLDQHGGFQEKYYRAHGDKTNVWGAQSEYVTTLNYGLNNMLGAVAKDLVSLCQGQKVEAYTYAGPAPVEKK